MHLNYQHELYPNIPENHDYDWMKANLLNLPTDKLKDEYMRQATALKTAREQEPPKKRKNITAYKAWVQYTHELKELLVLMEKELKRRANK